ncbi:MAG TPA: amidase [Candidatus Sulfotelmatobacter sp.]|nr:amidase [Candidatus Sulfotelmatobacter sp.]
MSSEPWQMDATDLALGIRTGRLSSREATQSCLARLRQVNPAINAVTRVLEAEALAEADAADQARARGERLGALHGVPVTVKVNMDQAGCATDNGVVALRDFIAPADGSVVRNLRLAGAVIIGRTNAPAFSMRGFSENELHGITRNPWNLERTPGGSSGGAGAAVASGIGPIGLGNDIAGSVRWPAFCNGLVGLRPSIARVPAFNPSAPLTRPFTSTLMAVQGPLTRSVRDARLAFQVLAEPDPRDYRAVAQPFDGEPPARPLRVALVPNPKGSATSPAAADAVRQAGRHLAAAGYRVEEVEPPELAAVAELWHRIGIPDVIMALKPLIDEKGDTGIKRFIGFWLELRPPGGFADFLAAMTEREGHLFRWSAFLRDYPLIVMPGGVDTAPPVGLDVRDRAGAVEALNYIWFHLPAPVLGIPSLAVPVGSSQGMPLGVQIMAARNREDLCLAAGEVIEAFEGVRQPIDPRPSAARR